MPRECKISYCTREATRELGHCNSDICNTFLCEPHTYSMLSFIFDASRRCHDIRCRKCEGIIHPTSYFIENITPE